jgi:hypothetical protein
LNPNIADKQESMLLSYLLGTQNIHMDVVINKAVLTDIWTDYGDI